MWGAVTKGFGDVFAGDFWGGGEVGNGAGDFEDLEVTASGKVEFRGGSGEEGFSFWGEVEIIKDFRGGEDAVGLVGTGVAKGLEMAGGEDEFSSLVMLGGIREF